MSVSLMTIEPCSGFSSPTSDFRNTDFPVPEGPRSTEISPGGRVRVTSLQMFWLPNDFDRFSTSTATPTSCPPLRSGFIAGSPLRRIDEPRQCAASRMRPHPDGHDRYYWWVTTTPGTGYVCHRVSVTPVSHYSP